MRFPVAFLASILAVQIAAARDKTVTIPEGQECTGRCVGVHDGDTMTVLIDTPEGKRQVKVRMDAIDAPELGQPFSAKSKQALSDMVFGKECRVDSQGGDKYGRTVGRVSVAGTDVNSAMLDAGMAWHYKKYDSRRSMAEKESAARAGKVGLWSDPSPIAPWDWRKMSSEERRNAAGATP
jgi:micrococcal nuclease